MFRTETYEFMHGDFDDSSWNIPGGERPVHSNKCVGQVTVLGEYGMRQNDTVTFCLDFTYRNTHRNYPLRGGYPFLYIEEDGVFVKVSSNETYLDISSATYRKIYSSSFTVTRDIPAGSTIMFGFATTANFYDGIIESESSYVLLFDLATGTGNGIIPSSVAASTPMVNYEGNAALCQYTWYLVWDVEYEVIGYDRSVFVTGCGLEALDEEPSYFLKCPIPAFVYDNFAVDDSLFLKGEFFFLQKDAVFFYEDVSFLKKLAAVIVRLCSGSGGGSFLTIGRSFLRSAVSSGEGGSVVRRMVSFFRNVMNEILYGDESRTVKPSVHEEIELNSFIENEIELESRII